MTAEPSSSLSLSLSLVLTFFSPHFFSPARLKAATHEAEAVRRDQTVWERKVGELQAHCSALEDQKYEALAKVRESVQLAEEAALQKDQVTVAAVWRRSAQLKYVFSPSTSELFFPLTCGAACFFFFLSSVASGSAQREAEDGGAREDQGGHQTADPGGCSPHQKRGDVIERGDLLKRCKEVM